MKTMVEEEKTDNTYPKPTPGTHVRSNDIYEKKITYSWWEPEVQYSWSLGLAMSEFLTGLKQGKILGIKCKRCERIIVPPRMFCELCYGPTDEWVQLENTGKVETFSISYLDPNAKRIKDPILIGVISIDGASPQHGFMHYFGEMKPEELKIGMQVEAVWKPKDEREGSITDIKYFRPLKGVEE